ncbi:hypothetical protein C0J52_08815 [Blattella germanica]|nr:hypothetical protein C0J52_08815 [Blattella germanica]
MKKKTSVHLKDNMEKTADSNIENYMNILSKVLISSRRLCTTTGTGWQEHAEDFVPLLIYHQCVKQKPTMILLQLACVNFIIYNASSITSQYEEKKKKVQIIETCRFKHREAKKSEEKVISMHNLYALLKKI